MKSAKQVELDTRIELPFCELNAQDLKLLIENYKLNSQIHRLMKIIRPSELPKMNRTVYEIILKDEARPATPQPRIVKESSKEASATKPSSEKKMPSNAKGQATSFKKVLPDPSKANASTKSNFISSAKAKIQNAIKARMKQSLQKKPLPEPIPTELG